MITLWCATPFLSVLPSTSKATHSTLTLPLTPMWCRYRPRGPMAKITRAHTNNILALYQLIPVPNPTQPFHTPSPAPPLTTPPFITAIIDNFANIFAKPHQLPPIRTITHHMHILPNTFPMNVKPYWYPYYQKAKLEK